MCNRDNYRFCQQRLHLYALKNDSMNTQFLHGVRMWVTEGCNASCHFCMNASGRNNVSMDFDKYKQLCLYFQQNQFDKIAIMGGEPTIHPHFLDIMTFAQQCFPSVYLFTNGLKPDVLDTYSPRESDAIIYNFNFCQNFTSNTFLLEKKGKRVVDIVIDSNTNVAKIIENSFRIHDITSAIEFQLVINNACNIFKHKKIIIENVNEIYNTLLNRKSIKLKFECNAPLCFTEGEQLPPFTKNTFCSPRAVLIDGSYNVRYCNIYNSQTINMFQPYGMIPFSILKNYIQLEYSKLRISCLEKICKDCLFYGNQCNGKCHIAQDIISKKDISQSTNIPWLK